MNRTNFDEHNIKKGGCVLKKVIFSLFFISLFIAGCSDEKTIEINNQYNDEQSGAIKDVIENTNSVHSGAAVFVEDYLLVAIQAKPWLDFKKRKIEKQMKEQLEEEFPDLNVVVSADYKLYWESQKLLEEKDEEKVKKEVEKLQKLAKEET